MRKWGRLAAVVTALWLVWAALAAAAPAAGREKAADDAQARRYLEDVQQAMLDAPSYHLDSTALVRAGAWGSVDLRGTADIILQPAMLYRSEWDAAYMGPMMKEPKRMQIRQYLEEKGNAVTSYVSVGEEWRFMPVALPTLPGVPAKAEDAKLPIRSKLAEMKRMGYDFVKRVAFRERTEKTATLDVTLDGRKIADAVAAELERMQAQEKARAAKPAADKKAAQKAPQTPQKASPLPDAKALREILYKAGDFSYALHVDEATKRVAMVDGDLTAFLRAFADAFFVHMQASPKELAEIQAFMQGVELRFEARVNGYGAVKPFKVPREVKEKAKPFAAPAKPAGEEPQSAAAAQQAPKTAEKEARAGA